MKKVELIKRVQEHAKEDAKVDLNQKQIDAVLNAYYKSVPELVLEGNDVRLEGVGTFKAKDVKEREYVVRFGDRAGETMVAPARKRPTFTISPIFKNKFK